ncbi:MAG: hypothetical protein N3A71_01255, partial [Candidatus Dojkabacteria bacterium]|nr:hypothetical protein [Candidatus Dojkabacteria bacterium]
DGTNNELNYGLIAQEVESVFPELSATLDNGYKGVRYDSYMMVFTIQAIKELNDKVEGYRYFAVDEEDTSSIFTNRNVRINGVLRIGEVSMVYDAEKEELRVEGNLTINEILKAKGLVTERISIKTTQNNIGTAVIVAGETEVLVENENINSEAKIFITAIDTVVDYRIEKMDGTGFKIIINSPMTDDLSFDYLIVYAQE